MQAAEVECHHSSVPMEGQAVHVPLAGMLSSKKRSRQVKAPFDASQTEYVKIPSAVKRPCVEIMTDRQKEVLARQKAGRLRMFLHHVGHAMPDSSMHHVCGSGTLRIGWAYVLSRSTT